MGVTLPAAWAWSVCQRRALAGPAGSIGRIGDQSLGQRAGGEGAGGGPSRAAIKSCDSPPTSKRAGGRAADNGPDIFCSEQVMVSSLTQAEVLIALVVAAHAGVLAVRLAASLYRA